MTTGNDSDDNDNNNDNSELEFYDYDNPEFEIDQGVYDEFPQRLTKDQTEEEIEAMRESRRRKNDEFQFETYYKSFVKDCEWRGEWTVYETSTFIQENVKDENGLPKLVKPKREIKAVCTSRREATGVEKEEDNITTDVIVHEEVVVTNEAMDDSLKSRREKDVDGGFGRTAFESFRDEMSEGGKSKPSSPSTTREVNPRKYWPKELKTIDFRGPQGNMCVGNAYTLCWGEKLGQASEKEEELMSLTDIATANSGPLQKLNIEVGLRYGEIRMRSKLDYEIKEGGIFKSKTPKLFLKTITICRERLGQWPTKKEKAFYGPSGATGGLFDPPPVGGEAQAASYMQLDLEGYATVLFPHVLEQDSNKYDGNGWCISLDWTPGKMRYQADRKFLGGKSIKGLKTLELSEVASEQAEEYRPRGGPEDMRQ